MHSWQPLLRPDVRPMISVMESAVRWYLWAVVISKPGVVLTTPCIVPKVRFLAVKHAYRLIFRCFHLPLFPTLLHLLPRTAIWHGTAKRTSTLSTKSPAGLTLALDIRYIRGGFRTANLCHDLGRTLRRIIHVASYILAAKNSQCSYLEVYNQWACLDADGPRRNHVLWFAVSANPCVPWARAPKKDYHVTCGFYSLKPIKRRPAITASTSSSLYTSNGAWSILTPKLANIPISRNRKDVWPYTGDRT